MWTRRIKKYATYLYCSILTSLFGCTKFVQVDPPVTTIASSVVFANNSSASAVMTGVYNNMISNSSGLTSGPNSLSFLDGLSADELTNYVSYNQIYRQFYTNSLSSGAASNSSNSYFWPELFNEIYSCNAVLEGVAGSTGVTPAMKQQLTGEAKFMRAFLNFYGVNLYGDFPLVMSTNYQVNNMLPRTPQAQVYQQIIADLKDAQTELTDNFVDDAGVMTTERIRPNKGAATALLARAYLYTGKWDSAEAQSSTLINKTSMYSLNSLNSVFLANSTEAIWQFHPVNPGYNTTDAYYFVLTGSPGSGQYSVALSNYIMSAFEPGDNRPSNWVGSFTDPSSNLTYYYPNKYKVYTLNKPVTEYLMALRLAEQYLIRAEARAGQNNISGAQSDLNAIRTRAGLPNTSAGDGPSLLTAILHERQVELFTEWGHRWFDLIRTGNVNSVMGSPGNVCLAKGGTWNSDWNLVPLPLSEIQINPNLKQNKGY